MSSYIRARSASLKILIAILAIAALAASDAGARPKAKILQQAEEPLVIASAVADAPAEVLVPSSYSSLTLPPPARFFTINAVLAKQKGRSASSPSTQFAALNPSETATDATPPAASYSTLSNEPFGLFTFRAPEGVLWVKWRKAEADIQAEAPILALCLAEPDHCPAAATRFVAIIKEAQERQGRAKLELVNQRVNAAIHYTNDFAQWGIPDVWSPPLATFASGRGDCEDYAIAKYVAMRESGTPVDDLRLLLVRDNAVRIDHAVLAVRHEEHWLILDNRRMALLEQTDVRQFMPLFAIDHRGVSLFAAPYAARSVPGYETSVAPAADDQDFIAGKDLASGGRSTAPLLL